MNNNWKNIKNEILKDEKVKKEYEDLAVEFGLIDEIIALRKKKKMTQNELAKKMGTTQSALSRFESGSISPTVGFLKRVAQALEVSLNVSFG